MCTQKYVCGEKCSHESDEKCIKGDDGKYITSLKSLNKVYNFKSRESVGMAIQNCDWKIKQFNYILMSPRLKMIFNLMRLLM